MKTILKKGTIRTKKALKLLAESLWDKKWFRLLSYSGLPVGLILFSALVYFILYSDIAMTDDAGKTLDFKEISSRKPVQMSHVYADNETVSANFFYFVSNPINDFDSLQPELVNAFVAAEDERFFSHGGVDYWAIGRAFWQNIGAKFGWNKPSGASTITIQSSRLILENDMSIFKNRTRSYERKAQEIRIAYRLERHASKKAIFLALINRIYFGHGNFGIAAASKYYFNKNIPKDKLTLREIAILTAMNESAKDNCPIFHEPNKPFIQPDWDENKIKEAEADYERELNKEKFRMRDAKKRFNYIPYRMAEEGYLNNRQYEEIKFDELKSQTPEEIKITPHKDRDYGYFARTVKELLMVRGYTDEILTKTGGLKIHTSLKPNHQKILSKSINEHMIHLNKELGDINSKEKLQGYGVILDVKTGHLLALSGGSDFEKSEFNRVFSRRSGGSAMKPFTYAAALEYTGMDIYDPVCNCPFRMANTMSFNGKVTEWWSPKNFAERDPVPMGQNALYWVLTRSVNLATLQLARKIGVDNVFKMYRQVGLWGKDNMVVNPEGEVVLSRTKISDDEVTMGLEPYLPTVIGGSDVNLLELAAAYGPFARKGEYTAPHTILKITDRDGKALYEAPKPKTTQAMSEYTAQQIAVMLRAVTKIGTAKITFRDVRQQVACKTGTSDGPNDLMMVCFTPEIIVALRLGYDSPRPIILPEYMFEMSKDKGMHESAGWVVGPLMRKIIDWIYENIEPKPFPENIETGLAELLANHALSPRRGYMLTRRNLLSTEQEKGVNIVKNSVNKSTKIVGSESKAEIQISR